MSSQYWEAGQALRTDAGMFGAWQPESFEAVTSLEGWHETVFEDAAIVAHIQNGVFVPINIGADGAFQFAIRVLEGAGTSLSERESRYLAVSSDPYLLISRGSALVGPIEAIGSFAGAETLRVPVGYGRHLVVVHLIDWNAEPGSMTPDGEPGPDALPDFIVEILPDDGRSTVRVKLETFDAPED
jgi:hypothetical protein